MSGDMAWKLPLLAWGVCLALTVLTQHDNGRVVTLRSEIHEWFSFVTMLPLLGVGVIVVAGFMAVEGVWRRIASALRAPPKTFLQGGTESNEHADPGA